MVAQLIYFPWWTVKLPERRMGNILLKLINFNKLQSYRKLDLISYDHIETSQCCIQMHFGTVWTVCARKKSAQKVIVTFFLNIFHVKTKWNIVYKYLKLPSPNALNINIFGHSATFIRGFWVITKLSNP